MNFRLVSGALFDNCHTPKWREEKDLESIMAIESLSGKKFVLATAAAVLGFGVAASFIVPSASASQNTPSTVVTTAPATTAEVPSTEGPSTEGPSTEAAGIDCNNGLDASGAACDGGTSANPNDNAIDSQSGSETETTAGVDGDNIQSEN